LGRVQGEQWVIYETKELFQADKQRDSTGDAVSRTPDNPTAGKQHTTNTKETTNTKRHKHLSPADAGDVGFLFGELGDSFEDEDDYRVFISSEDVLVSFDERRPGFYDDMCRAGWRVKGVPIRDCRAFVRGLADRVESRRTAERMRTER
jgi:hypothetical protein